jgi:sigma-B regulation protein RsbU (phosphoserine phosphatase)
LERQTELARQVQRDLLPSADLVLETLDFAAECAPAQQVGGDFYDAFSDDQGRTALVLGDVSGKGLPASVVLGLLLGAVRASDWMGGSAAHESASRRLSELLRTRTSLERFASLFWCYYERSSQMLRYVNAGHLPPMLVRRNEGGELEIQRLTEGGPVLGLLKDADYRQGHAAVRAGDLLLLYSDGVVEAESASGEQFDEARLVAVLKNHWNGTAAEIRDEMLRRVQRFLDKGQAQDDLTLVVVRIACPRLDSHSEIPDGADLVEVL